MSPRLEPPSGLAQIGLAIVTALGAFVLGGAALRALGGQADLRLLLAGTLVTLVPAWLLLRGRARAAAADNTEDSPDPVPPPGRGTEAILLLPLVAAVLVVSFLHLDRIPGMRYDEAIILQYPANFARHGALVIRMGEHLAPELWVLSTGMPLVLPAAFLFTRFEVGLGIARIVPGVWLAASAFAFWLFLRQRSGRWAALAGLVGFLSFWEVTNTGRMFLGDFAVVALLLAAMLLWLRSIEKGSLPALVMSGALLGLVLLAKMSYVVAGLGFLAYALHDRATERRLRLVHILVPPLLVALVHVPWLLYQAHTGSKLFVSFGAGPFGNPYTAPGLPHVIEKAREAAARPELWLGLPGLVYGLARGSRERRAAVLLAGIGGTALGWFVFFGILQHRYLILPSICSLLLAAPLIPAALAMLWSPRQAGDDAVGAPSPAGAAARAAALAVVMIGLLLPAGRAASNVLEVVGAKEVSRDSPLLDDIARSLGPAGTLHTNSVRYDLLFFHDRPLRVVAEENAATLPPGTLYLWCGDGRPPLSERDFDSVHAGAGMALLRRR